MLNGEEVFFIDLESETDNLLLYIPLRSYLAKVRKEAKNALCEDNAFSKAFFDMIKEKEYIDPQRLHKNCTEILPQLSIPITDSCNLRCEYCYYRAGDIDKMKTQSTEQIDSYIDAYFSSLSSYPIQPKGKEIRVSIAGGGEPTSRFKIFKHTIESIERKSKEIGIRVHFTMPTNGMYGDDVRSFIADHFSSVSLSFDGPKEIQDYQRPTKTGKGSFDTVFNTAKFFQKRNLDFGFRVTVTDFSVYKLKEILDFFHRFFPERTVSLEEMNLFGRAIDNPKVLPPNQKVYAEKLLEAYEYAYAKNIKIRTSGVGKYDQLRTCFCGSVGIPNWTITTDGRITSCTRDNLPDVFSFGEYNETTQKIEINEDAISKIRKLNVFNYPDCNDCFCKYNCAGDCPDLRMSGMLNCEATKRIGAYVLSKKIEELEE